MKILPYITIIIVAGIVITIPSIVIGFPDGGHDSLYHLSWFRLFSTQLWAGEFYPRWLLNENGGLGGPVFFYTPPFTYYATSVLRPLFGNDPLGWQQLGTSAAIGLVASGLTTFLWIRNITNDRTAIIAAILYMNMPYRVTIDLYERAAFNEFWAFVWIPLILYFSNKIKDGQGFAVIGMALSYALLILTHLPTTLIFSIIPVAYQFVNAGPTTIRDRLLSTLTAMILGASLSAIYLVPALGTQAYVHLEDPGNPARYLRHFMFTQLIPPWMFMRQLTLIVIGMTVLMSCSAFTYLSNPGRRFKHEFLFWVIVGSTSIYMMTPLSQPVVELFPIINRIQFPWRFNILLVLATTPIASIGIHSLRRPYSRSTIVLLTISTMLVLGWFGINIWQGVQETTRVDRELFNREILQGSFEGPTQPRWVQRDLREFAFDINRVTINSGMGEAEIMRWEPRDILIRVNSGDGMKLSIGQLYYPGWTAHIVGEPCCLSIQPSKFIGLITFYVPSGQHEISLRLPVTPQEFVGQLISVVSLFIISALAIWFKFGNRWPICNRT